MDRIITGQILSIVLFNICVFVGIVFSYWAFIMNAFLIPILIRSYLQTRGSSDIFGALDKLKKENGNKTKNTKK